MVRYTHNDEYINYYPGTKFLTRGKTPELFEVPEKILTQHVSSRIIAALDFNQYYYLQTINGIISLNKEYPNRYILALLNSSVLNFYYEFTYNMGAEFTTAVAIENLSELPITSSKQTLFFNSIINYVLFLDKESITAKYFIQLIDAMVFDLYFNESLKLSNKEIIRHLGDLKPLDDSMSDEEKLAIIQTEFDRLYDPNHPIRNNIETLDSVEEVRIIKEALK